MFERPCVKIQCNTDDLQEGESRYAFLNRDGNCRNVMTVYKRNVDGSQNVELFFYNKSVEHTFENLARYLPESLKKISSITEHAPTRSNIFPNFHSKNSILWIINQKQNESSAWDESTFEFFRKAGFICDEDGIRGYNLSYGEIETFTDLLDKVNTWENRLNSLQQLKF